MAGAVVLAFLVLVMAGVVLYLMTSLVRSITSERRRAGVTRTWANFGLGLTLTVLFFVSWIGHGVASWNQYAEDQRVHGEPVEVRGFVIEFSESTLENWQSEFLQLFSFVVLSALLIHRGSGESKDADERLEQRIKRLEDRLGSRSP